jgi:hypothetical protein
MSQLTHALDRSLPHTSSVAGVDVEDARWGGLFRAAAVGALLTGLLIPLQVVVFVVWPNPEGAAADWFELFRENPIRGLVSYDLLILLEEVLLIPIVLALYVLLRRRSESLMLVASAVWFVSIALFIGSNTGFEMLTLAGRHAEAATDAERAAFLASGEGLLAAYMGMGTSFIMGYSLASIAGILAGIAMLRTPLFGRLAAWAAIVANALGLALFLPGIGVFLSLVSVLILVAWYLGIGWRLAHLQESVR